MSKLYLNNYYIDAVYLNYLSATITDLQEWNFSQDGL